jgi:hypothetical protein
MKRCFELVLNLSAAKEPGREFPLRLLVRADESDRLTEERAIAALQ